MARVFVCWVILLSILHISECLQCFSCTDLVSHERCLQEKALENCPDGLLCSKYSYKLSRVDGEKVKIFGRACHTKERCKNGKALCSSSEMITDCVITCCGDKDKCNGTLNLMVSSMLVLACSLAAVLI